jgi:endonuclease-8
MPEGDTILRAANRIRPVLEGAVPEQIATPQPRHARDRWDERLAGRRVERVETHGKHLFVRFEGDLVLHSHLRMTGAWAVHPHGARWRRAPRRAWLVLRARGHDVVEFDGPVLELMTASRVQFDQRIVALGPDVLAPTFDRERFLRRLREDDPSRPLGDALIDQRIVAGLGNVWKAEGCWRAGLDPWRPLRAVADEQALAVIDEVRPRMLRAAEDPRAHKAGRRVYGRAGLPCPRCGGAIRARGQGDENRTTWWCPGCQR